MSSALAIAAVTAVLRNMLSNAISAADLATAGLAEAAVSALPPDRIPVADTNEPNRVNLFLYQVRHNQGWRNVGLPSRDGRGERTNNPALALDLYYLLSAYGSDELHAEILLGHAMHLLHETPGLGRDAIRRALNPPPSPGTTPPPILQALATAELAEQIEAIKICPHPMNTEEVSKLWAAFQAHYRPSAAYQVSVVLIESKRPTRVALPVREPRLYVLPFSQPTISAIEPPFLTATLGAQIIVRGTSLRAEDTLVRIGGTQAIPDAASSDEQLVVELPADVRAGINAVQVLHRLELSTPPARNIFESNVAALVVRPLIRKQAADPSAYDITVTDVVGTGDAPRSATITARLTPPVGKRQRVVLLLNEVDPPSRAYSFEAPSRAQATAETTTTIAFSVSGVAPGEYLVRVQVDGAQSPLDENTDKQYVGPKVEIP